MMSPYSSVYKALCQHMERMISTLDLPRLPTHSCQANARSSRVILEVCSFLICSFLNSVLGWETFRKNVSATLLFLWIVLIGNGLIWILDQFLFGISWSPLFFNTKRKLLCYSPPERWAQVMRVSGKVQSQTNPASRSNVLRAGKPREGAGLWYKKRCCRNAWLVSGFTFFSEETKTACILFENPKVNGNKSVMSAFQLGISEV